MYIGTRAMRPSSQTTEDFYLKPAALSNDDMLYLRYAIDQITREDDASSTARGTSEESRGPSRGHIPHPVYSVQSIVKDADALEPPRPAFKYNPKDSLASLALPTSRSDLYLAASPPVHSAKYPPLTFLPTTLRPLTMGVLILFCLLISAGLIFCVKYADSNRGLWAHTGRFDSRYFIFKYLPQIIAAIFFLWIEGVMAAVGRITPFVQMTSEKRHARQKSLFLNIYPTTLLWPRFSYLSSHQPLLGICSILIWPVVLTIPLASCLFNVRNVDGVWKYTTVTSIAWSLLAIYLSALIGLLGTSLFFSRRETGLLWDPRSLADIIALLSRSNCMDDYDGTDAVTDHAELRDRLEHRADRLGYWRTTNPTQDIFYGIGVEGAPVRRYSLQPRPSPSQPDSDIEAGPAHAPAARHATTPLPLRRTTLVLLPLALAALLLALLLLAFLPATTLHHGFPPRLPVPRPAANFSPSAFFYAFLPSSLALLLATALTPTLHALARLTPWAALSHPAGSPALPSLLADYPATAAIPFAAVPAALTNAHYPLALFAATQPLLLLLPVLAGGLFGIYTTLPSGRLLLLADMHALYVILALLALQLAAALGVSAAVCASSRSAFALPKPTRCLADLVSLLAQGGVRGDAAFRAVRGRTDLRTRLVGARERGAGEVRFCFGVVGANRWGVERVGRKGPGGGLMI